MMRRLYIPVLLVAVALLAPVVICEVPGTALNAGSDCCKHMSAGCGDTQQLSECCTITVSDAATTAPTTKLSTTQIQTPLATASPLATLPNARVLERPARSWITSLSPPIASLASITILRI